MIPYSVQPTLIFKDGEVSGNAGCNNYTVPVTLADGDSISIGLAMATKMYCTNMKNRKSFFRLLTKSKII